MSDSLMQYETVFHEVLMMNRRVVRAPLPQ
jgi:hypothetical protein